MPIQLVLAIIQQVNGLIIHLNWIFLIILIKIIKLDRMNILLIKGIFLSLYQLSLLVMQIHHISHLMNLLKDQI